MMLNNLNEGYVSITENFGVLRSKSDESTGAGSPVSNLEFITHLIYGLGQLYYYVVIYVEANILKVSVSEAYSMLLTCEAVNSGG